MCYPLVSRKVNMTKIQNDNLRKILDWLEQCPIQYSITSMSSDCIFIKCIDTSKYTLEKPLPYYTMNDVKGRLNEN